MADKTLAHTATFWTLACGHTINCGCNHIIDKDAYCWLCPGWQRVVSKETKFYATRAAKYA